MNRRDLIERWARANAPVEMARRSKRSRGTKKRGAANRKRTDFQDLRDYTEPEKWRRGKVGMPYPSDRD